MSRQSFDVRHLDIGPQKNTRGDLGPICNFCGGFGFTLTIGGTGSAGCQRCGQTGVEPVDTQALKIQVNQLSQQLNELKGIIVQSLSGRKGKK